MRDRRSIVGLIAGLVLVLFGLGCLNYTKDGGAERHHAFAARYRLPPPSGAILLAGAISLVAGGGMIGFAIGAAPARANRG